MTATLPEALEPLRSSSVWCVWKKEKVNDRVTKVPYQSHTSKAQSNNRTTWRSFDKLPLGNGFAGPGLMLGDGRQGVDLDVCITADGELEDWAAEVVKKFDTYTEISDSDRGLKAYFYGPPGKSKEVSFGEPEEIAPGVLKRREIALYTEGRFFAVSGKVYRDRPLRQVTEQDVAWLQEKIETVRAEEAQRRGGKRRRNVGDIFGEDFDAELELLPAELQRLIREGVSEGERSEQFHHAACWCADCGMTADRITALLGRYPAGIAAKYLDRLEQEVVRCLEKRQQDQQQQKEQARQTGGKADGPIAATPYVWRNPHEIPPRGWLFRRHYIRKFVVATAGPPGGAKSSINLVDAISMVIGRDLLTGEEVLNGPLRVWLYNTEDPREEIERRLAAICLHYGLGPGDFGNRLFIDTAREQKLVIARSVNGHAVSMPNVVGELVDEINARNVDVFIGDPLIHTHAVSENDNTGMGEVMSAWREVAERGDCCVELLHHIRKNGGQDTTADDMRGAGAILGSVRSLRLTTTMSREDAKEFGIAEEERRFHVWVNPTGKPSLVPPVSRRDWYYMASVDLGNANDKQPSDHVGVATRWKPPGAFDGITVQDAERVWAAIRSADPLKQARVNQQADGWAGKLVAEVLDLDIDAPGVREQVARMLREWEQAKTIAREEVRDGRTGRKVPVYRLGSVAEVWNRCDDSDPE